MIAMIKKFILFLLRIFRRALCCFSRKKCDSQLPEDRLEAINVVSDQHSNRKFNTIERSWQSWDDSPQTVQEHIEVYRESLVKPKEPETVSEVETIDLFADMAPKILKQKKVFLNQGQTSAPSFSRLEASALAEIPATSELQDWCDEENGGMAETGWGEISDRNTKELIREKRKEIRFQKQKNNIR